MLRRVVLDTMIIRLGMILVVESNDRIKKEKRPSHKKDDHEIVHQLEHVVDLVTVLGDNVIREANEFVKGLHFWKLILADFVKITLRVLGLPVEVKHESHNAPEDGYDNNKEEEDRITCRSGLVVFTTHTDKTSKCVKEIHDSNREILGFLSEPNTINGKRYQPDYRNRLVKQASSGIDRLGSKISRPRTKP